MNAKMPDLKRAFEKAGFTEVKTVLSSGNIIFDARIKSLVAIERKAEEAMGEHCGRAFYTIVRGSASLQRLIHEDPFKRFKVPANGKKVVTFLREAHEVCMRFPVELDGAKILGSTGREVFTYYVPGPKGPVFMSLIEKMFGKNVTTRTWDTVKKCAVA
jgi:uncharacterized protein (DUF1697 family)